MIHAVILYSYIQQDFGLGYHLSSLYYILYIALYYIFSFVLAFHCSKNKNNSNFKIDKTNFVIVFLSFS